MSGKAGNMDQLEYSKAVRRFFVRRTGRVVLKNAEAEERRRAKVESGAHTPRRAGFVSWAGGMVF